MIQQDLIQKLKTVKTPQRKTIVQIKIEGLQSQQLQIGEQQEEDILFDYDQVCKKILQAYNFIASGKHNIRIILLNFYGKQATVKIPIWNPKNWTTLIADMLQRDILKIEIEVLRLGELRQKRKRTKGTPVQFDSDGSIESVQENTIKLAIQRNTPSNEPFRGDAVVRCHFCQQKNNEGKGKRISGPFYGPFPGKVYGHLLCLIWCSAIFINKKGLLQGIKEGVAAANRTKCEYCKQKGASFLCHRPACLTGAHYRCAFEHNWHFNWANFTCYCPQDIVQQRTVQNNSTKTLTNRGKKQPEVKMEIQESKDMSLE